MWRRISIEGKPIPKKRLAEEEAFASAAAVEVAALVINISASSHSNKAWDKINWAKKLKWQWAALRAAGGRIEISFVAAISSSESGANCVIGVLLLCNDEDAEGASFVCDFSLVSTATDQASMTGMSGTHHRSQKASARGIIGLGLF
eukprot:GDKK01055402.1.p2 GENE.GDKK01055402.1~~GDKK01055402.1.p2  ORF type:complete len:147 (-),score=8.18 GDKK01055402.1:112-552(-)